jgi:hypothetical protein
VVNTPIFISEIGNELATQDGCDVAMMWNYLMDKKSYSVSLRSHKDKQVDVSVIAKR